MWYTKHDHGNERFKIIGLQCFINFHLQAPSGPLYEATIPCLRQLGESACTISRRYFSILKQRIVSVEPLCICS